MLICFCFLGGGSVLFFFSLLGGFVVVLIFCLFQKELKRWVSGAGSIRKASEVRQKYD